MSERAGFQDAGMDTLGRVLAEASSDFVCLTTTRGEPFYLNPAGQRLIGLGDGKPIADITLRELYIDDSWAELRDVAVPEVNRSGSWEGRSRLRNVHSGEPIEVQTKLFRVRSEGGGRSSCLMFFHRLVDRQARLEQTLAETEGRKRAILESSLDPIITIDHKGIITEFNKAAEQTFGHPREKVLGTKPSEVLFPPGAGTGRQQDRIDRYLQAGEGSLLGRRVEVIAVRGNGESFDAEMAMTLSQEQGAPVLTFFIRDISRRKKAEQEQARYAAELERSNRELEMFAYVASHDLQEPLRKIRAFCDRLQANCAGKLDDTGADCLQRILSAASRMQALIDGLLSLSRVTTQGHEFVAVDLAQIAREVLSDLEVQIEQSGGRVELGHLPTIQADPLQMRQLLQNLIANGLKFHKPEEPPVVKVGGRFAHGRHDRGNAPPAADEQCKIIIEDNGIGFEQRHQERIFGIFQRLHPRDVFEGVGIGLALCRKIAERHGGCIAAYGSPGHGARFEIVLPAMHGPVSREN
ncbi:MAG: PAS domain S-box protein [Planctomycetaceae bacterium]|nr:PAS domain S-box protein [Planctomycetaceae bacterium]